MAKQYWKGGALLSPLPPVMVSCGDMERSNIITVAWAGMVCTKPPVLSISVRPERASYPMIRESGEFAVNLTTAALARVADYCGTYTGRKVDKFERCGLTKEKCSEISCPAIAESPLTLECRVREVIPLGSHDLFIADIVAVGADESLLDESGKLHLERAGLAAYSHGSYFELGGRIGAIGFSTDKPAKKKNGRPPNKG